MDDEIKKLNQEYNINKDYFLKLMDIFNKNGKRLKYGGATEHDEDEQNENNENVIEQSHEQDGNNANNIEQNIEDNNEGPPDQVAIFQDPHFTVTKETWKNTSFEYILTPKNEDQFNIDSFFDDAEPLVYDVFTKTLNELGSIKAQMNLLVEYEKNLNDVDFPNYTTEFHHWDRKLNDFSIIQNANQIGPKIHDSFEELRAKIADFETKGSGWSLKRLRRLNIKIHRFLFSYGGKYVPLPSFINNVINKKGIYVVNIKNNDNKCFKYAITRALFLNEYKGANYVNEVNEYHNIYKSRLEELESINLFENMSEPMKFDELPAFEDRLNKLIEDGTLVYKSDVVTGHGDKVGLDSSTILEDKEIKSTYDDKRIGLIIWSHHKENEFELSVAYRSIKYRSFKQIHLYYWQDHLIFIDNIDSFLSAITKEKIKFVCHRCLQTFQSKDSLFHHVKNVPDGKQSLSRFYNNCIDTEEFSAIQLPKTEEEKYIRFDKMTYKLRNPSVIYINIKDFSNIQMRVIISWKNQDEVFKISSIKEMLDKLIEFELEISTRINQTFGDNHLMNKLDWKNYTKDEIEAYKKSDRCYLCFRYIKEKTYDNRFVPDHCHLTNKLRGAACYHCNKKLNFHGYKLSVFVNDLKNHMHDILQEILMHEATDKKGIDGFPYKDSAFPRQINWKFNGNNIIHFKNTTEFLENDELGNKFEIFRKTTMTKFNHIDPANFRTLPTLGYNLCLDFLNKYYKMLDASEHNYGFKLEAITKEDIFNFMISGVRGGIVWASLRYAKANNPYCSNYNPKEKTSYIINIDCNSLYPFVASKKLPFSNFKFVEKTKEDLMYATINDKIGYFIEISGGEAPINQHKYLKQFPMLAEKRGFNGGKPKLIPHLERLGKMLLTLKEYQFAIEKGYDLEISKVLQFKQTEYLKPFVDFCVEQRQETSLQHEKEYWKLIMNSFIGKTFESKQEYSKLVFCNNEKDALKLAKLPQCITYDQLNKEWMLYEIGKNSSLYNCPLYIGLSILGNSKYYMSKCWYKLQDYFKDRIQLCYTATDSFIIKVETEDFFQECIDEKLLDFDFSNFPQDHKLYNDDFMHEPGYFKDESKGIAIEEFVALSPNVYSIKYANNKSKTTQGGNFEAFKNVLFSEQEVMIERNEHSYDVKEGVTEKKVKKRILCRDDKLQILNDNIHTLPHGFLNT